MPSTSAHRGRVESGATSSEATGPTTPLLWLPSVILESGEDPALVCRSVGLDFSFRRDPLKPFPFTDYAEVIAGLERRLARVGVGVDVAHRLRVTDLPRVFPLVTLSETVGEYLHRLCRAMTTKITPGAETRMRTYGDRCLLYMETPRSNPRMRTAFAEYLVVILRCIARGALGPAWNPERLLFHHQGRRPTAHLRRCAPKAALVFSSRYDGLEFPATLLDESIPPPELDLERLRRALYLELVRGRGSIERTARSLGLSKRSLQRRLSEQGLTYRRLLLDLRMELASRLLSSSRGSIGSISQHLSYGYHSDFTRAFRARHGVTPIEYRRAAQVGRRRADQRERDLALGRRAGSFAPG